MHRAVKICAAQIQYYVTILLVFFEIGLHSLPFYLNVAFEYIEQLYSPREVAYNNIEQYKQKQDRTDRKEKRNQATSNVTKMMMTMMAEAAK